MTRNSGKNSGFEYARSLLVAVALTTAAQLTFQRIAVSLPQDISRKIISDDFTKNRKNAAAEPTSKSSDEQSANSPAAKSKGRRTYKLAVASAKGSQHKSSAPHISQLGITIWRLRPAGAGDTAARMLVREKGNSSEWVPERVEADTTFREGDRVRLSIESLRLGYLYVVDRDLLNNGTTGDAMLIYPWINMASGDNKVGPGKLIDIPAQDDEPSYFTARPTSPDQAGEILTVIVTDAPLDVPISNKPLQISKIQMFNWENMWGGRSERFEMEGGAGEAWTSQEQQAAASKGTRQLTRDDPAPQTIYRISAANNTAILVNVRLRYVR